MRCIAKLKTKTISLLVSCLLHPVNPPILFQMNDNKGGKEGHDAMPETTFYDMAFHVVDKATGECKLIPFMQGVVAAASPVLRMALLSETKTKTNTKKRKVASDTKQSAKKLKKETKERSNETKEPTTSPSHACKKDHEGLAPGLLIHLETTANRSSATFECFLTSFLPFGALDLHSRIFLSNVAEWMELAFEFEVKPITNLVLDWLEKWSEQLTSGTEESNVEYAKFVPRILSLLERFKQDELLAVLSSQITNFSLWSALLSSPSSVFISAAVLGKALIPLPRAMYYEAADSYGKLCLVKVLERKDDETLVHYVGWALKWDAWISQKALCPPLNSIARYNADDKNATRDVLQQLFGRAHP